MAISRARMIIIAINNEVTIKKIISLVAKNFPHIIIIVRLPDLNNVEIYKELGAHYLIPETYEVGLQLGAVALSNSGFSNHAVALLKDRFRMVNYDVVKNKESDE